MKGSHKQVMFLQFILLVTTANAVEYGPSILSLIQPRPAQLPFLDNLVRRDAISSKVHLEDFSNFATVLPIADRRPWIRSEDVVEVLGSKLSQSEPFVVIPPREHGMMVVIQELQIPALNTFNRSLLVIDESGMIMECFSKIVFQIEGKSPVHVCGRTDDDKSVLDGVGPRSFIVPIGKSIKVSFIYRDEQITKNAMVSKQVPFYDFGYLFRGSIAFTAYKNCPHGPPYLDFKSEKLWPCDIPQSNREPVSACVREGLFCDGVINCGVHNSNEFGLDERFCRGSEPSLNSSFDPPLLEEAINSRVINQVILIGKGRPRPNGNDFQYPTENIPQDSDVSHPAFVTLVILITIICVIIVALVFHYCCKRCVGKPSPPYGHSSNPEALARFHENLRNRDTEAGRRGNDYSISDTLFKPQADELPPKYEELFPQEYRIDKVDSFSRQIYPVQSSIYTIPVQQQLPSANPVTIFENERIHSGGDEGSRVINNCSSCHNPNHQPV